MQKSSIWESSPALDEDHGMTVKEVNFLFSSLSSVFQTAVATNIVYDGKVIWSKTYGALNESAVVPQTPLSSTLFPVASVSKVFTVRFLYCYICSPHVR